MNGLVAQKFDSITRNDFIGMQNYDKIHYRDRKR